MDLSEIRCFPRVQELYDAMEDDYAFFKSVLQTSCIQSTEKGRHNILTFDFEIKFQLSHVTRTLNKSSTAAAFSEQAQD